VTRITWRRLFEAGRSVAAIYGLALAITLYTPLVDWLALPLLPRADVSKSDAIVVLSAWAKPPGELNESGLRRTLAAGRLYRAGVAPVVVVTGGRPTSEDEGDALDACVRLLEELGVPRSAITVEDQSANTHESAVNVARLASARSWTRLAIVTDDTHMRRARLAFVHERLQVSSEPTRMWQILGERPTVRLAKLGAVVHEYGGLLYYRARGWI
jgi:uncharacterized SAM-binding protein YcdF (DUF218 family)